MILPAYWLVAVIRIWAFHPDSSPFEPLCIQIIFHKIRFVKGKCASFTEHLNCKLSYFHIEEAEPKPKTKTETYFFICPALLYKKLSRNKIWHLLNGRLIDFLYIECTAMVHYCDWKVNVILAASCQGQCCCKLSATSIWQARRQKKKKMGFEIFRIKYILKFKKKED